MTRAAALLLVMPLLAVTCGGSEYKLPVCSTTVTQEPTGDLASDLVGAWSGTTDEAVWHHPIAYMAGTSEVGGDAGAPDLDVSRGWNRPRVVEGQHRTRHVRE
jgi:hypothetical protein